MILPSQVKMFIREEAFSLHCEKCDRVWAEGYFLIQIRIDSQDWLVENNSRAINCCGSEVKIPRVFQTQGEALQFLSTMLKEAKRMNNLDIPLIKAPRVNPPNEGSRN